MMTREEVAEIMTYCQEHTVSTKTGWPNLESLHGGSMMQNPDLLNNKHKPNLAVESYHTLSGIVSNVLGCDPCNVDVYIFMNRSRNRKHSIKYDSQFD